MINRYHQDLDIACNPASMMMTRFSANNALREIQSSLEGHTLGSRFIRNSQNRRGAQSNMSVLPSARANNNYPALSQEEQNTRLLQTIQDFDSQIRQLHDKMRVRLPKVSKR